MKMNLLLQVLYIGIGGALGALCRAGLGTLIGGLTACGGPGGTIAVNLLGCFSFGLLDGGLGLEEGAVRIFLLTGFMGSFTTFSTFQADAIGFWQEGSKYSTGLYLLISLAGGAAAFVFGIKCVDWFSPSG